MLTDSVRLTRQIFRQDPYDEAFVRLCYQDLPLPDLATVLQIKRSLYSPTVFTEACIELGSEL